MNYVIKKTKDGREISRTPRSRGKAPKGAILDGKNLIIIVEDGFQPTESSQNEQKSQPSQNSTEVEKVAVEASGDVEQPLEEQSFPRTKEMKAETKHRFVDIRNSCVDMHAGPHSSDDCVVLDNVFVAGKTGWKFLEYNSVYHRVVLKRKENMVEVWILRKEGPPDYRITDCFSDQNEV